MGRIKFNDCPRSGRRDVRRNVNGERESDVLPATSLVGGTGRTFTQFSHGERIRYHETLVFAISCPLF